MKEPQHLWAERSGIDGANLRWTIAASTGGGLSGFIEWNAVGIHAFAGFALRGLDPNTTYTAEVRTVWQDGTLSEKKAQRRSSRLRKIHPPEMFLSDLDPVRLTPGWRQPELNRNFNSGGLSIGGRAV